MMRTGVTLIVLAFVFVLISSVAITAQHQQSWIPLTAAPSGQKPAVQVQSANASETVVEFEIAGLFSKTVSAEGENFHVLRFPGYFTTLEVGKPQLPVITEQVIISDDANPRVEIVQSDVEVLEGYRVYPFQKPLLEEEAPVEFDIDRQFYAEDKFYPEHVVNIGPPEIWRDIRVARLTVQPVQYNPATGELRIHKTVVVRISTDGTKGVNVLSPPHRAIKDSYDNMYRNQVLGYELRRSAMLDRVERSPAQDYGMLIIAVDRFADEMIPLKTWKNSQGLSTQIASLSSISATSSAGEIKDYITQEFIDHNIEYVLLVGDNAELPSYLGYRYGIGNMASDYWYSLLSGNDLLPEIAVGRFSTMFAVEVDSMVNKTIAFEDGTTGDWTGKVQLVAHKQDAPAKYQLCSEDIRNATYTQSHTYRNLYPNFFTSYGAAGATNQDVVDAIDDGRLVVNYRGHGWTYFWSRWNTGVQYFSAVDVAALNNGDKTPVVFGIACRTSEIDSDYECLGEAFTKSAQGAVAYLGATRSSYTLPNHTYDQQLFATIFDEGNVNIGHASNIAAIRMMNEYGGTGNENAKMYLWLGDPSLEIPVDPVYPAQWLVLIDTSATMASGDRLENAKEYAIERVSRILQDPDDEVALATFAGNSPLTILIDRTGDENALIARINSLTAAGATPLADAICAAFDEIDGKYTDPRLILVTAGGENASVGACSGTADPSPNPPWCDENTSWNCKVVMNLGSVTMIDVGYFGDFADKSFLIDLAAMTYGEFYDPTDAVCGNGILEPGEECETGIPCDPTDEDGGAYTCLDCQCAQRPPFPRRDVEVSEWWYRDRWLKRQDSYVLAEYDFDSGSPCDPQGWTSEDMSGYGDFAGLVEGKDVLQEDTRAPNPTCLWAFINGSTENYGCGGHPGQSAVPYRINNEIRSPLIALDPSGAPTEAANVILEFEVYRDLPLDRIYVYRWRVRSWVNGTPTEWRSTNFGYYGDTQDWHTHHEEIGPYIETDASHIQIALGVVDMSAHWSGTYGTGDCHGQSPLLDNVKVYKIDSQAPAWIVRDIDLFQDTFPTNGTSEGAGRADMAISYDMIDTVQAGDSTVVTVDNFVTGLEEPENFTGFGSAVYCYVAVRPQGQLGKSGPDMVGLDPLNEPAGPGSRWPHVASTNINGVEWHQFRMDTVFAKPGRVGPVPDRFCFDMNDTLFTAGDTINFFFGASTPEPMAQRSYWSEATGTTHDLLEAVANPMEFQILPGGGYRRGGCTLYVDDFDGRGGQPIYDWTFKLMHANSASGPTLDRLVDRYDVRGPTSIVGNGPGGRVRHPINQLVKTESDDPIYQLLIWDSGDLKAGLIGDGSKTPSYVDDFQMLHSFLDPDELGWLPRAVYLAGNNIAEEWSTLSGPSALAFKTTFIPHELASGSHKTSGLYSASPPILPAYGSYCGMIYDWQLDPMLDGGWPVLDEFDMIRATGPSNAELYYVVPNGDNYYDGTNAALVLCVKPETSENRKVFLGGFSFSKISDMHPNDNAVPVRTKLLDVIYVAGVELLLHVTAVHESPTQFTTSLSQNYPNPFNPVTAIRYSIRSQTHVSLKIYDVAGRLVMTLVDRVQAPKEGGYKVTWNGLNNAGNHVASGIYFYRLVTADRTFTKKMLLLK